MDLIRALSRPALGGSTIIVSIFSFFMNFSSIYFAFLARNLKLSRSFISAFILASFIAFLFISTPTRLSPFIAMDDVADPQYRSRTLLFSPRKSLAV